MVNNTMKLRCEPTVKRLRAGGSMQEQKLMLKKGVRKKKKPEKKEARPARKIRVAAMKEEVDTIREKTENIQLTVIKLDKKKIETQRQKARRIEVEKESEISPKQDPTTILQVRDKAEALASKITELIAQKTMIAVKSMLNERKLAMSMQLMRPIQIIEKASFKTEPAVQSDKVPLFTYNKMETSEEKIFEPSEKVKKTLTVIRSMLGETQSFNEKPLTAMRSMLEKTQALNEKPLVLEKLPPLTIEKVLAEENPSVMEKPSSTKKAEAGKRSPTGIPGLDDLIEGGFAKGDLIAIAGKAGTGKSTLGMQFLVEGALEHEEAGVYVSFIENSGTLHRNFAGFGWDLKSLNKAKKIKIMYRPSTSSVESLVKSIWEAVASIKAKRLVIDSITSLVSSSKTPVDPRAFTRTLYQTIKKKCVTLLITGVEEEKLSFGIDEIVDGIMVLEAVFDRGEIKRQAIIRKMRGTRHSMAYQDMAISSNGLSFRPMPSGRIPKIY